MQFVNSRKDVDALPLQARAAFMAGLAASLNRWSWINNAWTLTQETTTIERFEFAPEDFPDAPIPPMPGYNPDEVAAKQAAEQEAQQEKAQANEEFEPARLAPALKVLTEKLLLAEIAAETLPERDAQAVALLVTKWEGNGVAYATGRVLERNGNLYEVMQPHTSQADWAPEVANTLFRRLYAPTGGIPLWQVWDGHNDSLHQVGSEVMHYDLHWISTVPNNHWEPGTYGWELAD